MSKQGEYTVIHRRRWITIASWSLRRPGHPDTHIEVVRFEGATRYGVLWASGHDLRIRGGLDRKDADTAALKAREKYAPTADWLDTSVR